MTARSTVPTPLAAEAGAEVSAWYWTPAAGVTPVPAVETETTPDAATPPEATLGTAVMTMEPTHEHPAGIGSRVPAADTNPLSRSDAAGAPFSPNGMIEPSPRSTQRRFSPLAEDLTVPISRSPWE